MASKSAFLPRLSLSRNDESLLPFYNANNKTRSEYDLTELSPHPEDPFLSPEPPRRRPFLRSPRNHSPAGRFSDMASNSGSGSKAGSVSKMKTHEARILFAGPPPPIATSRFLYRDEEEPGMAAPRSSKTVSFAQNAVSSIFLDRDPTSRTVREPNTGYEPDTMWRNLQRRERTLQEQLQRLLDAQAVGLAANLDPHDGAAARTPNSRSDTSEAGTSTPTDTLHSQTASAATAQWRRQNMTASAMAAGDTPLGSVIPVRQPRPKPVGLRAARAGLAHTMAQLADLKASEDTELTEALGARKRALVAARGLAMQRDELAALLHEQEDSSRNGSDPLGRELRELRDESAGVAGEIAELEERLAALRNRQRWLDSRVEDVRNRREAGLSGYRGALRDVEKRVASLVRRPPVKPLDIEAILGSRRGQGDDDAAAAAAAVKGKGGSEPEEEVAQLKGAEFLRLRPDRRTIDMAKEWWEAEVAILERRKAEVNRDRAALEEGIAVWNEVAELVSGFERALRKEMRGEIDDSPGAKGKHRQLTPEQAMHAQLDRMATVITGLRQHLQVAEEKGWNLLICAVGAELEAFEAAEAMLRGALRAAGLVDEELAATPRLGRSTSWENSGATFYTAYEPTNPLLEDLNEAKHESDARVTDELLTAEETNDGTTNDGQHDSTLPAKHNSAETRERDHEDSENEVPPEFLAEHRPESDDDVE